MPCVLRAPLALCYVPCAWLSLSLQVVHEMMLSARKGLPGHAIYSKVRNATELIESSGGAFDRPARAPFSQPGTLAIRSTNLPA